MIHRLLLVRLRFRQSSASIVFLPNLTASGDDDEADDDEDDEDGAAVGPQLGAGRGGAAGVGGARGPLFKETVRASGSEFQFSSTSFVSPSLTHVTGSGRLRLYLSGRHDVTVTGGGGAQQCRPADAQRLGSAQVLKHGRVCDVITEVVGGAYPYYLVVGGRRHYTFGE